MAKTNENTISKLKELNIDPALYEMFDFKPRKGDLKKIEILKATIECLGTLGVEKTTYEAIASKIDTRRAHVAYHFKDKHDLFKAAIKYIVANYQQISISNLSEAKSGKDMLYRYVDAVFTWASKYPNEVSVMLLLYYFCTFDNSYKELNDQIRAGGVERIHYILSTIDNVAMSEKERDVFSKNIFYKNKITNRSKKKCI